MKAYKVIYRATNNRMYSYIKSEQKDFSLCVEYPRNKPAKPKHPLFPLMAFKTLNDAKSFISFYKPYGKFEIWECQVKKSKTSLKKAIFRTSSLFINYKSKTIEQWVASFKDDKNNYDECFPIGTIACSEIKLIKRVDLTDE